MIKEGCDMNSFDEMFDFNHDGRLDAIERAGQMSFLEMAMGIDGMDSDDTDFEMDDDNYDEW